MSKLGELRKYKALQTFRPVFERCRCENTRGVYKRTKLYMYMYMSTRHVVHVCGYALEELLSFTLRPIRPLSMRASASLLLHSTVLPAHALSTFLLLPLLRALRLTPARR